MPGSVTGATDLEELRALATQAAQRAYAPYSKLNVGAALRSAGGTVYLGCNVENAAYPIGGCAERAAIAAAVHAEGADFHLEAIAVAAFDATGRLLAISPCGACRQALVEFGAQARVSFHQPDGSWSDVLADDLLPWRFVLPPR
ncbi:MAG: cytidine deaminase [Proteobacteria bacterium]|nr:cytidine deaminase [Pseudomonadota bacterium]